MILRTQFISREGLLVKLIKVELRPVVGNDHRSVVMVTRWPMRQLKCVAEDITLEQAFQLQALFDHA